jgi:hypothetical protein
VRGDTPAHLAARWGHLHLLAALLQAGEGCAAGVRAGAAPGAASLRCWLALLTWASRCCRGCTAAKLHLQAPAAPAERPPETDAVNGRGESVQDLAARAMDKLDVQVGAQKGTAMVACKTWGGGAWEQQGAGRWPWVVPKQSWAPAELQSLGLVLER